MSFGPARLRLRSSWRMAEDYWGGPADWRLRVWQRWLHTWLIQPRSYPCKLLQLASADLSARKQLDVIVICHTVELWFILTPDDYLKKTIRPLTYSLPCSISPWNLQMISKMRCWFILSSKCCCCFLSEAIAFHCMGKTYKRVIKSKVNLMRGLI